MLPADDRHVELTGIINKPLLLHLVGCLYYLYTIILFLRLAKQFQFIPLQNVVYIIRLSFLVRKIFTFYVNDVLLFKSQFPGPKGKCESHLLTVEGEGMGSANSTITNTDMGCAAVGYCTQAQRSLQTAQDTIPFLVN